MKVIPEGILRPDSNLAAWLAVVARRHVLPYLRRRTRERVLTYEDVGESNQLLARIAVDTTPDLELMQTINQGLSQIGRRCLTMTAGMMMTAVWVLCFLTPGDPYA